MSECDACGKQENMPYQCGHCGGTYCAEHRLPEAHDCPGLDNWSDPGGVFDSGFDESVNTGQTSGGGGVATGSVSTPDPAGRWRTSGGTSRTCSWRSWGSYLFYNTS